MEIIIHKPGTIDEIELIDERQVDQDIGLQIFNQCPRLLKGFTGGTL
jgi:hypothetical protein